MISAVFATVAGLELISIILIFIFKDILHSVLALSASFLVNSIIFFLLGQPLIALLQLFIMAGGVSTYMFVGVASISYSKFRHTSYSAIIVLSVLSFLLYSYNTMNLSFTNLQQNTVSNDTISNTLSSGIGIIYIIAFMLFSIGIGSIVLLKKISGKGQR